MLCNTCYLLYDYLSPEITEKELDSCLQNLVLEYHTKQCQAGLMCSYTVCSVFPIDRVKLMSQIIGAMQLFLNACKSGATLLVCFL
jgi:hypothetical protein